MTVEKLIEELQKYPKDMFVVKYCNGANEAFKPVNLEVVRVGWDSDYKEGWFNTDGIEMLSVIGK